MIQDADAEMLESLLSSEPTDKKIVLVISSPGGLPLAAERIANVLRAYSPKPFEAAVPHMAKSAATMICFGAAAIHMSQTAELGPVDPQVPYWTTGEEQEPDWIAAEEYVRAYDKLMTLGTSGKAKRLEPIMQQLSRYDSRYVEKVRSAQKLSEDISIRLLKTSVMKKRSVKTIRKSIDVFLTQARTRTHGRMINHAEAKQCGLNIKLIDLHSPLWHTLWELFSRSDWSVRHTCSKLMESSKTAVYI
ncbi:MAG TPA: ATP-dependent Clp protease proteolytic subunit [Candidatus Udaeobacter sp.]|nr:ATP-dependent Clp protease proteolytic subunit [Candidatus Udaeobacter sp.]